MEVLLNHDVEKLWELQQALTELSSLEQRLTVKPEDFAEVDSEFSAASTERERLTQSVEDLSRERRRVDGALQDQQEVLKKYQGQLMQVKNQQQYTAAWKEIDGARKQAKELEESELKVMGDIEGAQKQLEERGGSFDGLKQRYDEAYAAWQHSLSDLRAEIGKLRTKIEGIEESVPESLKREFHKIFKQRQGIAVVRVINESCGACRVHIRPAVSQQLKRGEMVFCEGCRRLLYGDKVAS
jgi:predicted  nucleic acid-binding Zn-ribbon protein